METRCFKIRKPEGFRLTAGTAVACRSGRVWITADNQDIILKPGENVTLEKKFQKAVIVPLADAAGVAISRRQLLFEKLSLLDKQARLSGSFAG